MVGVVIYGSPASPSLCKGVMGEEHKSKVIELELDSFICEAELTKKNILQSRFHDAAREQLKEAHAA